MTTTRAELQRVFTRLQSIALPRDCDDDELSVLHAELIDYDTYSAGLVTQVLEGRQELSHPFETADDLRVRLERIVQEAAIARSVVAKQYIRYLDEVETLVNLAKTVGRVPPCQR